MIVNATTRDRYMFLLLPLALCLSFSICKVGVLVVAYLPVIKQVREVP